MKKFFKWLNDSSYTKPLSPACKRCSDGSKMVVLITGLCPANCFYCPLSKEKLGKDRIFADEWELKDENDTEKLILEAQYIKATGAGITGGDPLAVWKRTKKYIQILKDHFGTDFHIHLYTSGIKNSDRIEDIVSAGLDEIRFHPMPKNWKNMNDIAIKDSVNLDVDVAIEIPAIPDMEDDMFKLITWADQIGVKWINLNELEFSETNAEKLIEKGFTVKDDLSSAVKGSQETAYNAIKRASEQELDVGVHYCSSSFKDGIQLRNRIMRRAKSIAKEYEIITEDGTILKGIITSKTSLDQIKKILVENFKINDKQIFINRTKNRIELPINVLEKIVIDLKKQGCECFIVEEYPTADQLEVERIVLPQ